MNIAERLKYARDRSAMTLAHVEGCCGIGASSISDFENGKRDPSLSQLQALAKIYKKSASFFLADGEIEPDIVLWRQKPDIGGEAVEADFLRLCEQYHNLEIWANDELPVCLPVIGEKPLKWDYRRTELLAKRVRDELNLGDRPGLSLLSVLEEVCGIKIFHLPFEPTGTAASSWSENYGACMLLNAGSVRWRRNFDLAHELFHLLTWQVFRNQGDESSSSAASTDEEKQANAFASHLLLPAESVRLAVAAKVRDEKLGYTDIYDIARQFDVSAEALLWRLYRLKLLPDGVRAENIKEIIPALAAMSVYEDRKDTEAPKWPERYKALAVKALQSGSMSIGRFAEYMEVSRQVAMKYSQQEPTDGQEISLAPA